MYSDRWGSYFILCPFDHVLLKNINQCFICRDAELEDYLVPKHILLQEKLLCGD